MTIECRGRCENTRAIAHSSTGKTIERRGRREMEQPKVGPKGELSGSERVKIEIRRAGAFVERMWLSKKKTSAIELASVSLF